MIELTHADVLKDRFQEAFNILIEKDLDIAAAFELANSIDPVLAAVSESRKSKDSLIMEFGKEVKDGEKVIGWNLEGVSEDKLMEFETKLIAALETKVPLPLTAKIKIDKAEKIKPIHVFLLDKLVEIGG